MVILASTSDPVSVTMVTFTTLSFVCLMMVVQHSYAQLSCATLYTYQRSCFGSNILVVGQTIRETIIKGSTNVEVVLLGFPPEINWFCVGTQESVVVAGANQIIVNYDTNGNIEWTVSTI